MTQRHIQTFENTASFIDAYNSKKIGVPYIVVIKDIRNADDTPLVLYSNRLPYKDGEIEAPQTLSQNCVCGQWVLGASRL